METKELAVALFGLNIFVLIILAFEPFWKIGAWITFGVFIEIMAYILNLLIFRQLVLISGLFNLVSIGLGMLIVVLAHLM